MIPALILLPFAAALLALALPGLRLRRALLVVTAIAHTTLAIACLVEPPAPALYGWLELDALGTLFLCLASVLFLAAAVYCLEYLRRAERHPGHASERVFIGCLLAFLAAMTLATTSQHVGLFWVAIEATTLSSAPLVYFRRDKRSLEATWKYLLLCSVGIALALMGTFCLALAGTNDVTVPLVLGDLVAAAGSLHAVWVKAAFLLLLVGYGTKMGLAPLHSWLPDAHSESPAPVSALLSGALLNCAFLGILRGLQVCTAAGLGDFARELLVGMGLVSMLVAAAALVRPADFKRMLAYSSVEHMGILSVGVGLGAAGSAAAMYHAVNHSLSKGMLFLLAGNILAAYGTTAMGRVSGVLRRLPWTGALWLAGFLAIAGLPPFGLFLSELGILRAAVDQGSTFVVVAYLALLAVAFVGLAGAFLGMSQGAPPEGAAVREAPLGLLSPVILTAGALALGCYVPAWLSDVFARAAQALGGAP